MTDHSAPQPEADPAADSAGNEQVTITAAELEQLRVQAMEWKERCARQQAEFENVRKRLRREADEAGTRAITRCVRPVLDELDNLERAIAAARPETFNEFAQGVSLIRENLKGALAGNGIEPIPCDGTFDPSVHEVLAEEERADLPKGTIVRVHRSGWKLRDQLVRTAQVVVSRPPAAPSAT